MKNAQYLVVTITMGNTSIYLKDAGTKWDIQSTEHKVHVLKCFYLPSSWHSREWV